MTKIWREKGIYSCQKKEDLDVGVQNMGGRPIKSQENLNLALKVRRWELGAFNCGDINRRIAPSKAWGKGLGAHQKWGFNPMLISKAWKGERVGRDWVLIKSGNKTRCWSLKRGSFKELVVYHKWEYNLKLISKAWKEERVGRDWVLIKSGNITRSWSPTRRGVGMNPMNSWDVGFVVCHE